MTAEPDLRSELVAEKLRPTSALRAACQARQPRGALACAILLLRTPERTPPEADAVCEWAARVPGDHRACAAAIVEAACRRDQLPEACVVLALDQSEALQRVGRNQLSAMREPVALYYTAALERDPQARARGLQNACNLGEAVACASLSGALASEACLFGDCSATTDGKKLAVNCQTGARSACAQLVFWRVTHGANANAIDDAIKQGSIRDPAAAKRGAKMREQFPEAPKHYMMSCSLGSADGCKQTAHELQASGSYRKAAWQLANDAARLMSWRLSDQSQPLPDL